MNKQKYHFLTIREHATGSSLFALPGQYLGKKSIPSDIIVKDVGSATMLKRTRRKAKPGDIFFTTTLRLQFSCLKAKDIYPLLSHDNILFCDVYDEYKKYLEKFNNQ